MIAGPNSRFVIRLDSNEMIERERFAALLAAIENQVRTVGFAGPQAVLAIGAVDHGSIEVTVAIVGSVAATLLAIPGFLVALRQLAQERGREPNDFAVALAEVMALDGVMTVDLKHRETNITIRRDEVPFVQRIARGGDLAREHPRIAIEPLATEVDEEDDLDRVVEDEDQDWVPVLKAGDAPPREAYQGPSGQLAGVPLIGEFEMVELPNGDHEMRFLPRDTTLAPYFVVTSNAYDPDPIEFVQYQVVGNVTLEAGSPGLLEIVTISPPDDTFLSFRS